MKRLHGICNPWSKEHDVFVLTCEKLRYTDHNWDFVFLYVLELVFRQPSDVLCTAKSVYSDAKKITLEIFFSGIFFFFFLWESTY